MLNCETSCGFLCIRDDDRASINLTQSCTFYLRWLVVVVTVTNTVVEGILLSRVMALYREYAQVVKVAASFLYAGGVITLIGLTIKDYVGEPVNIVEDFSALPGCYAASVPNIIAGYWIAPTIIESSLFGLVLWRVIAWSRANISIPPALFLMARDSAVYFAIIFALLFVNLFVFEYAPPFLSSLFVTPVITTGCIAGSRILLNLRGLAETETNENNTEIEMGRLCDRNPYFIALNSKAKGPEVITTRGRTAPAPSVPMWTTDLASAVLGSGRV
ncbi:hypothetical protein ACEPAG_3 [Sanghuangporus baumii]